jgi:hypothetical protein
MSARLLQPWNAKGSMLVTLSGIAILVSLPHPENDQLPMLVTLLPITTLVMPLQSWNALSSMLVTLPGIVILVRLLQYENALYPMLVTLSES